jgi:mannose/cellobiose epimerase-like protein (N-acyl-D-glucosamine 2-epimerase family)
MSKGSKMPRRDFLALAAAASASHLAGAAGRVPSDPPSAGGAPRVLKLAGMSLSELRARYRSEFFETYLPFWDRHGIDHEYGGFMCALDHDGTLVNSNKFHWFQGRGIWVYSFLYNHFARDPHYLEIARKAKDFMLAHFPQKDGWWAEVVSREGKVLKPFHGDTFGMYFAAEGLQEYAYASGDDKARATAFRLMKKLFAYMNQPGVTDPETGGAGVRSQGVWMVTLRTATQILRRWNDAEISAMGQQSVDAVIHKHYNPEFGLNTETLNLDFSRPKETANITVLGHSVETLWMIMDEALRRNDQALYDLCVQRVRRHLDVGWDYVFGGLADSVNVDQGCYQWPVDNPVGTDLEFRAVGEYKWVKTSWSIDEVLLATLNITEHKGYEWAVHYFDLAQDTFDKKFSLKPHGLPLFQIFGDRRVTFQPHSGRQENYHHARQYMLNLLALDRMIGKGHA